MRYISVFLILCLWTSSASSTDSFYEYIFHNRAFFMYKKTELLKEKKLLEEEKILPADSEDDLHRLYLWTTPVDLSEDNTTFETFDVLSYPMYSAQKNDNVLNSPLTSVLAPLRKDLYDLGEYGFSTKIIGLYIGQYASDTLPFKPNKAGFLGVEAYSNWMIGSSDFGLSSITFELGYQKNLYGTADLSKSVGSIITSNVILGDSGAIIGDIYYTQGFFNNKVLVHAGRLTPWYYYGYNTFTDSETNAFMSEMFSGSVALPSGGGNGSKPGMSLQYFISQNLYFTSVLTNTEGKDADFDFDVFNKDAYFLGGELGYVFRNTNLTSRISLGLHKAKVKQDSGERKTGNGFNIMYEQELTPKSSAPYIGVFLQYEYSDKHIAVATQQISGGINIRHPFNRHGDGFGFGFGTVKPSDKALRDEYFADTFYRLQLTQNLQWSFDLQLYINPSKNVETTLAPIFNTRMLFSF